MTNTIIQSTQDIQDATNLNKVIADNQTKSEVSEIITSPLRAIRAKCVDCCCGQISEVRNCPCTSCPLHSYRMGKSNRTRTMTDEQKEAARDRLIAARAKIGKG